MRTASFSAGTTTLSSYSGSPDVISGVGQRRAIALPTLIQLEAVANRCGEIGVRLREAECTASGTHGVREAAGGGIRRRERIQYIGVRLATERLGPLGEAD